MSEPCQPAAAAVVKLAANKPLAFVFAICERFCMLSIETYREKEDLTYRQLAEKLGTSPGHASDLAKGIKPVTRTFADRLETLTGKPWWKWMTASGKGVTA